MPQPLAGWLTKCIFGVIYDQPLLMSPGGNGGTNWAPMAFSPRTGLFYVTAADRPQSRILRGLGKTVGPPIARRIPAVPLPNALRPPLARDIAESAFGFLQRLIRTQTEFTLRFLDAFDATANRSKSRHAKAS